MAEILTDSDFRSFLQQEFSGCYYIPNPGNAGDSLIASGTFDYFDSTGLKWHAGAYKLGYGPSDKLVYGGGGNLIGVYHDCEQFLRGNRLSKLLILPHTIKDVDNFLNDPPEDLYIICRDFKSYNYVSKFIDNVFLHEDMAYKLAPKITSKLSIFDKLLKHEHGNFFRKDVEKTSIVLPDDNVDLSALYQHPLCTGFPARQVTEKLMSHVAMYESISTNRLHVAIAGQMLKRHVNLHANSYWKNKEVYDFSMKDDPNVTFIDA